MLVPVLPGLKKFSSRVFGRNYMGCAITEHLTSSTLHRVKLCKGFGMNTEYGKGKVRSPGTNHSLTAVCAVIKSIKSSADQANLKFIMFTLKNLRLRSVENLRDLMLPSPVGFLNSPVLVL